MAGLTRAQQRHINEIDEVMEELGLDRRAIVQEWALDVGDLTTLLQIAKKNLITAAIVHEYTFFDELLGSIIARYFFGKPGGPRMWRTKRFRRFNHYILERLYVLQKLALVKDLRPSLSRETAKYIERVNDLRNAVAHSFFPENLRGQRTTYRGLDVFTIEGFRALRADREPVVDELVRRAFGA